MHHPLQSLRESSWFKLICGASFQHLPDIRSLALAYSLAGADCIDVAADLAVVAAASDGIRASNSLLEESRSRGFYAAGTPLLMVSFNDGEDPHFRKAELDASLCPEDCPRPCEAICPAGAIAFSGDSQAPGGVITDRCYGCGRCLPVCPIGQIQTRSHFTPVAALMPHLIKDIDAVEIHTQIGRVDGFRHLWGAIAPYVHNLQLIAISCPDGDGYIDYLWELYTMIAPLPCPIIWQTDGRAMSGDIGDGTTHAAIRLSQKVLDAGPPGYVQLAGGTNRHTVPKLRRLAMLDLPRSPGAQSMRHASFTHDSTREPMRVSGEETDLQLIAQVSLETQEKPLQSLTSLRTIAGVAYGSYARTLLSPVLEDLEKNSTSDPNHFRLCPISPKPQATAHELATQEPRTEHYPLATSMLPLPLEACPDLLWQAVTLAHSLTSQLKSPMKLPNLNQPSFR